MQTLSHMNHARGHLAQTQAPNLFPLFPLPLVPLPETLLRPIVPLFRWWHKPFLQVPQFYHYVLPQLGSVVAAQYETTMTQTASQFYHIVLPQLAQAQAAQSEETQAQFCVIVLADCESSACARSGAAV